jgi:TatD DNase family protein
MSILKEYSQSSRNKKQLKGVLHCFSAGRKAIKQVEELGFYFGLDGNLTYDLGLQNVVKEIPLERILLETDSPFLSPEPYRGLRNEPKNVKIIAEFLTRIKETSFEETARTTTQNAKNLLKI